MMGFSERAAFMKLIVILMVFLVNGTSAQVIFTHSFTSLLENHQLEIKIPVEPPLHVSLPAAVNDFDLCIADQLNTLDFRFAVTPPEDLNPNFFPKTQFFSRLSHIATNDEMAFINVSRFDDDDMEKIWRADWAMAARFTPKREFSSLPYGLYVAIFRENGPLVEMILCSEDPDHPSVRSDILSFR